jgi:hypothetical protein
MLKMFVEEPVQKLPLNQSSSGDFSRAELPALN